MRAAFLRSGWCGFEYDPSLAQWIEQSARAACAAVSAPENGKWLRCGGTWFVGVNALPNGPEGAVAGGSPLAGQVIDFIHRDLGLTDFVWDRGQVSVVYPGYPRQMDSESDAAFDYRRRRDAAHIDGVSRKDAVGRRYLRSFQAFILGIPTAEVTNETSPLVVWERSHERVRRTLRECLGELPPDRWSTRDLAAVYRDLRREIFANCERVELTGRPGEAWLVHRLALHGIAPWSPIAPRRADGRMVIYFRPELRSPRAWLDAA